jgi:hypothetical protein
MRAELLAAMRLQLVFSTRAAAAYLNVRNWSLATALCLLAKERRTT